MILLIVLLLSLANDAITLLNTLFSSVVKYFYSAAKPR
jgi:hypothetical protein